MYTNISFLFTGNSSCVSLAKKSKRSTNFANAGKSSWNSQRKWVAHFSKNAERTLSRNWINK